MKAILVIDVPVALEHLLGEEMLLYISHMDGRYIMTESAVLRPIPNEACDRLVGALDAMEKMKSVEVRVVRKTE